MPDSIETTLLRALLSVTARQAVPPPKLSKMLAPQGAKSKKQLRAYSLCDGTRTQAEVAKALKLDQGNFSRTVGRWIDTGVLFRLGSGRDAKLLHLYPLNDKEPTSASD
jgi:hypothetical protein